VSRFQGYSANVQKLAYILHINNILGCGGASFCYDQFETGYVTGILEHTVSLDCTDRCWRWLYKRFMCEMHYTNNYETLLLDIFLKILMMMYIPRKPICFSIPHNHRHFSSIHSALLMHVLPFQTEELKLEAF